MLLLLADARQVLEGRQVDVHEALDAVGHARLLRAAEAVRLDGARGGDALLPALVGEVVGFC